MDEISPGTSRFAWRMLSAALLLATTTPVQAQQTARALSDPEEQTARYFDAIRSDPSLLLMFLREMPKGADLHTHGSGAIYAETLIGWAAADGLCVDVATTSFARPPCDAGAGRPPVSAALQSNDLRDALIDGLSMRNWNAARPRSGHTQFFGSFNRFRLVTGRARTADVLVEITTRAAANRVSYVEVMTTPDVPGSAALGTSIGWDPDLLALRERLLRAGLRDTVAAASRMLGAAVARQRELLHCDSPAARPGCGVELRFLYQGLREQPPERIFAQLLAAFELATLDPRVVGLNLVQPEDGILSMRDYSLHMRMIGTLRPLYPGVRVSLHAGELTRGLVPPEGLRFHIREAVHVAQANRIGHGVAIAYEDSAAATLQELARRAVLVEIALSSNDAILGVRGADHPLALYLRHNVPVALATDDEGVLRSEMTLEYLKAARDHGVGYIALKAMARNSLEFAFVEGESLWRDFGARTPADGCTVQTPAASCERLLARSARARLQMQLERAFAAFEQAYARSP